MPVRVQHRNTWLCPDPAARERMVDMDARLQRPRALSFMVLGLAVVATVPTEGLWPLAMLVAVFFGFATMSLLRDRIATPEYALLGSWAFSQVAIAAAVVVTGGLESFAMAWLLVPIVTLPARFGPRGLAAGVALTAALMLAIAFLIAPDKPGEDVFHTVFPLAGLIAIALLSTALMRSDVAHRTESVIDGLTGMLNRRALDHRLDELEAQSAVTGEPVAVIAGDVDHFKAINDEYGHATGDAVLVEVAYRMRKALRAFDLAYRIGGEEFVILLPGATVGEAVVIAEDLRESVGDEPVDGIDVTISFGVAGSGPLGFDRDEQLAAADAALYAAKDRGRDCVVASDDAVAITA